MYRSSYFKCAFLALSISATIFDFTLSTLCRLSDAYVQLIIILSFAQYMVDYVRDSSLPQLKKEVNLAGTFNGVLGMNEEDKEIQVDRNGKPSHMNPPYQEFMQLKSIYRDKNIDVLNMYGDLLDGTHSDGRVSNSSSKSLKYLLGDSPKSYQEVKYEGKEAQHSALHENEEVAQQMIRFL